MLTIFKIQNIPFILLMDRLLIGMWASSYKKWILKSKPIYMRSVNAIEKVFCSLWY